MGSESGRRSVLEQGDIELALHPNRLGRGDELDSGDTGDGKAACENAGLMST